MIFIKYNDDDSFIGVSFKRLTDCLVSLKGTGVNTSGFKTYTASGEVLGDFSNYRTVYKVFENEVQYSSDGSVYNEPEPTPPRELTRDEIKQILTDAVQEHLDLSASERGYDGILSVCSYFNSDNEKFDREGAAARIWRSAVWEYCYAQLDRVLAGEREIPTVEELINELPKLDW